MLLPSTAFMRQHFPGLPLSAGLFYRWPIGIRFDLQGEEPVYREPGYSQSWSGKQLAYNEPYFQAVNHRASALFAAAFQPADEVALIYQKSAYKRGRIRSNDFLFRQLGISRFDVVFKKIANPYQRIWHLGTWVSMHFFTTAAAIPVHPILAAIANQDFRGRSPVIHGDVFFLNISRGLIFHLYDDRGLDIVAVDKALLRPLFQTYNSWILEYDRAQVEATFAGV